LRVLHINSVVNTGSTGRIVENIALFLKKAGHDNIIAYGRGNGKSDVELIKIGGKISPYLHGIFSKLFDRHGFGSRMATKRLIKNIDCIKPDIIALYNLHGYYINVEVLFNYLSKRNFPIVWTLFDCWAFTGHCTYFDDINCVKWKTHCEKCPKYKNYPKALIDNTFENFEQKRNLFNSIRQLELVTHSLWLADLAQTSFLKKFPVNVSPSAIDLDVFKPTPSNLNKLFNLEDKKVILGCASTWTNRKGYMDFIQLAEIIPDSYRIVMIGLNQKELQGLPKKIIGLRRTESIGELAQWYSLAHVFVNPTTQDNFPTTNLESLACGTPVITYNTGGSPEAIDASTGYVVDKGDIHGIFKVIESINYLDYDKISENCRKRAESLFDRKKRYADYLSIFERILK
jgi:putative colanic acid biosynthesis glycosyltransferase